MVSCVENVHRNRSTIMFMNMNIELLCKSTDVDLDGCTPSQEVIFF